MMIEFLIGLGLWSASADSLPQSLEVDFVPPIAFVEIYPPEGTLRVLSGLPLVPETEAAYLSEFQPELAYFGAFAVGKDGSYGYVIGSNSLQAAREIAFEECEKYVPACLIYAEIVPEGYAPLAEGQATMSAEAAQYFQTPEERPRYRAMAVSEDGAYSMVWGHADQPTANRAAISDCEEFRIRDLPNLRDMPCMLMPLK